MSESTCIGNNLGSDECVNYCLQNNTNCQNAYLQFCSNPANIQSSLCNTFCTLRTGVCDNIVRDYCSNNPADTNFCGCINLQAYTQIIDTFSNNGVRLDPACLLKSCANNSNAYKLAEMRSVKCSNSFCIQGVDVTQVAGGTSNFNSLNQNCEIGKSGSVIYQDDTNLTQLYTVFSILAAAALFLGLSTLIFKRKR